MAQDAKDVENLLNEVARDINREARSDDARNADRRDDRDRGRERADRDDRRDSRPYRAPRDRTRESDGDGRSSRNGERRRRDGSRPSSSKDADTDEDYDRDSRYRRGNSRDRYHGSRRDRAGDYYNPGGRNRSRSPGGRNRSRSPLRRDRDDRRRDRSREPRRDDDRRAVRRRTATPEVTENDRDKRTIFVQQISQRAETRHLRAFFERVGEVVEAQIVKDRVNGRSKGVGYVEFRKEESVQPAIQLTGHKLKGVPIIAQLTEAEKNRASRVTGEGGPAPGNNGAPFHRLFVGNIHFSVTESDLKDIFAPYGNLEQVSLQRETEGGRSKGYGFVQFVDPNNAKEALQEMNGFELAGRQIRVGLGNDKFTPESTAHLLRNFPQQTATYQGSAFSGAGGRGAYAGGTGGIFDRSHGRDDRGISGASALDDTDMSGVNFKTVDRNKLMRNLARDEIDIPTTKEVLSTSKSRVHLSKPTASKCIKIENAFDPEKELADFGHEWTTILETEVKNECNLKYGKVVHISADPNSEGDIYVKFDSVSGGEKALQGLNGRNFNYRQIHASYVIDKIYNSLFGAAAEKF